MSGGFTAQLLRVVRAAHVLRKHGPTVCVGWSLGVESHDARDVAVDAAAAGKACRALTEETRASASVTLHQSMKSDGLHSTCVDDVLRGAAGKRSGRRGSRRNRFEA